MKTIHSRILSCSLILGLGAPLSVAAQTLIPVSLDSMKERPLGAGYNSRTQTLFDTCVDNAPDQGPAPAPVRVMSQGSLNLDVKKDEKAVADKLGISGSGRYQMGVTSTSATAEFLKSSASNEFKVSYNYIAEHQYKETMDPTRAYPIRPLPGFAKRVGDRVKFFSSCGDEYVRARNLAARLMVNISVSFVSKTERNRFATTFDLTSPTVNLAAKLDIDHSQFSSGNRMTVQVVQTGGDTAKMGKILCPANASKTVEKTADQTPAKTPEKIADAECDENSRVVVSCAFGDLHDCTSLLAQAVAYANSSAPGNFSGQIAEGKNFQVVSLETMPYLGLGDPFVRPPSDPEEKTIAAARKRVMDIFQSQYKRWNFAQQLHDGQAPRLSDREKSAMEKLMLLHFRNMNAAVEAVNTCYDQDLRSCAKAGDDLRVAIGLDKDGEIEDKQYKAIQELTKPESFVQYCDVADDDHPEIRDTIHALMAYAQAINAKENSGLANFDKGDRCYNFAMFFEGLKTLDLSEIHDPENPQKVQRFVIADLGPIAVLNNLEELILPQQGFHSIEPLKILVNLKRLNLNNNQIADISPVLAMPRLETLNAQNNQITPSSMASLKALGEPKGRLSLIDVRGNREPLECPLPRASSCKTLSFKSYANISSASTVCEKTRGHQAVALDSNRILVTGGRDSLSAATAKVQIVTNQGCQVLAGGLHVPRVGHTMTDTNQGTVLIIGGGSDKIEFINRGNFEVALLAGTLQESVSDHTATLLPDGRILVVGGSKDGQFTGKPSSLSRLIQTVDPRSGRVEVIGQLYVPRAQHTATLLPDGKVLIVGGYSLNDMLDIAEVIDPSPSAENRVQMLEDRLPVGRAAHSAVALSNGHVLIIGGKQWFTKKASSGATRSMIAVPEIVDYDPQTLKFRLLREPLTPARYDMQVVTTEDNRVILIGGTLESEMGADANDLILKRAANEVQIYDPVSEGVYDVGTLLNRRLGFTATAVSSTGILVFGGEPRWSPGSSGKPLIAPLTSSTEFIAHRAR